MKPPAWNRSDRPPPRPLILKVLPPPAMAKPASVSGERRKSAPTAPAASRLVVVLEPSPTLPSVVCAPPNPDVQTLQPGVKAGSGALVISR